MTVTSSVAKDRKRNQAPQRFQHLSGPEDLENSLIDIIDDSFSEVDDVNDPDWTKTPLYKRIQKAVSEIFFLI